MLNRVPRTFASSQPGPRYFARISGLDSKLPQASTTAPARIATGTPRYSAMTPASRPFSRMRLRAGRLVENGDAAPLHIGIKRLEQFRPAAPDVQGETAPELELAVDLVGLAAQARLQLDALARHPFCGVEAAAHQDFGEVGIGAVLGQREQVVEELRFAVGAEIDVREVLLRQRRQHRDEIVDAAERKAESAAGKVRIAAALFKRSGFEHQHPRAVLVRRDRTAQGGIAGPDHEDIRRFPRHFGGIHGFPAIAHSYWAPVDRLKPHPEECSRSASRRLRRLSWLRPSRRALKRAPQDEVRSIT